MAGRSVRLTPKGLLVMVRQRRISLRRCSGVGWVKAVRIPRPPALDTAEASSAVPTCYIFEKRGLLVSVAGCIQGIFGLESVGQESRYADQCAFSVSSVQIGCLSTLGKLK